MRAFLVLALVAFAAADVKYLYDAPYNKETVVTTRTLGSASSSVKQEFIAPVTTTFVKQGSGFSTGSTGSSFGSGFGSSSGSSSFSGTSFGGSSGSSFSGTAFNGGSGAFHDNSHVHVAYNTKVITQTKPLVSKSSYIFSAPEDNESFQHDQEIVLPRPRQHYNVVFIKAPATTIVNTPSAAVGGKTQEKTLVYVLTDKQRIENHIEVPEVDQAKLQKPEVFFIKNNKPTEVVNSKIKYETVDLINGAENGAVNGVPNKVSGNGALLDEYSNPEAAQVAQTIYQAIQTGGLEAGVQTLEGLFNLGYSIGGNHVGNYDGNSGSYKTGSTYTTSTSTGSKFGSGLVSRGSFAPSDSVTTTELVSGPSTTTTFNTGVVTPASQTVTKNLRISWPPRRSLLDSSKLRSTPPEPFCPPALPRPPPPRSSWPQLPRPLLPPNLRNANTKPQNCNIK